ncbi:hypothetical protein QF026_000747 [Streptomyces aurantiacus]|nr:hypothetical protein [Streptomyces aurantiacus]
MGATSASLAGDRAGCSRMPGAARFRERPAATSR